MPTNETALAPVASQERIHALDLLRGWALFGVLWSNLNDSYGTRDPVTALDRGLSWTQNYLVESRFYSLLILLFGVGFGIQLLRATERGTDLRATYYRRSAALLAIGVVHGTLIWSGDILAMYALVSFALVMFRAVRTRRLLAAALFFWFLAPVIVREVRLFAGRPVMIFARSADFVYPRGSWLTIEKVRLAEYLQWFGRWGLTLYCTILAAFLMGLWAVKSGYLKRVVEDPRTTRRLLLMALCAAAVGYASNAYSSELWPRYAPAAQPQFPFVPYQLNEFRGIVLSLFGWATMGSALVYAAILILLWQRPLGARVLRPLAATGQMALTTYLTQSVVCTQLFYGYGRGWYGRVGFTGMFEITLVLFAVQMAFATWWLARFRFGPVEWFWRTLSYGRAPQLRRDPA